MSFPVPRTPSLPKILPHRAVGAVLAALVVTTMSATSLVTGAAPAAAVGTQTLKAAADAGVFSGQPTTNWGTSTTARIDHSASADRPWYVRFAAPVVPAGERIVEAHLRFTTKAVSSGYTKAPAVKVADTSTSWSETTLTYADRPAAGALVSGTAAPAAVGAISDVTLKGYTGGALSLVVQATDAGSGHVWSREDTGGHGPVLVVRTAKAGVQPDLSPATGSWLGWYLSGNGDPRTKESTYGRQGDAFRRYYSLSDLGGWPTAADVTIAKADSSRRVLFASVTSKCFPKQGTCPTSVNGRAIPAPGLTLTAENAKDFAGSYWTPQQITSGALDPVIDAEAARIKATGLRFVLDLMPEVDTITNEMDDTTPVAAYGGLTLRDWWETTYRAAFQHWVDRLKAQGATNVVFAMDYAGFRAEDSVYQRTYPGDAYVDWIAWDPYDFKCTKSGVLNTWKPFYTRVENGLLGTGAKSKSYGLFETGVGKGTQPGSCRVTWVNGMAEAAAALPKIKAVLYFNRASADYNLDSDPAVQAAWVSEIQSSYFNQPHS
ncbi:DNRLRE domain-containing protein [Kineococcus sp. GCM10028916]|uniref:CBM96 family carbohydrate-binding protein n=1 Tax=Kineococcus sp. GCM10028916 TaxID=3273394 RepID=UPI00363E2044